MDRAIALKYIDHTHLPPEVDAAMKRFAESEHRDRYRKRGSFIESVNGFIRGVLGFDRWLLRGVKRVKSEGKLMTTGYQLRTLHARMMATQAT